VERYNPKLAELPDHKHYPACLSRKVAIQEKSQSLFIYTLAMGLILIMLSFFSLRFSVISWLPMLMGESTEVLPFFVQLLTIIMIIVIAALNYGKHKICGVVLFFIYAFMAVFGFINSDDNLPDIMTSTLGAFGTVRSITAFKDYTDWKQLVDTEGFPFFSVRVTEATENPNYQPQYTGAGAATNMSSPVQNDPLLFTGQDVDADMPEIPSLAQMKAYRDTQATEVEFVQEGEKYCCISESPIKII